jgi:hypothetical protein
MNNNMTLFSVDILQPSRFISAIPSHTWLTLLKVQALLVQVVEVQLRDVELVEVQVPVEMLLTSHKSVSNKSQKK